MTRTLCVYLVACLHDCLSSVCLCLWLSLTLSSASNPDLGCLSRCVCLSALIYQSLVPWCTYGFFATHYRGSLWPGTSVMAFSQPVLRESPNPQIEGGQQAMQGGGREMAPDRSPGLLPRAIQPQESGTLHFSLPGNPQHLWLQTSARLPAHHLSVRPLYLCLFLTLFSLSVVVSTSQFTGSLWLCTSACQPVCSLLCIPLLIYLSGTL